MRKKIEDTLLLLGITPNLKGFVFLCEAVELAIQGADSVCKGIYMVIAERHNVRDIQVERGIRHAITKIDTIAWANYGAGGLKNSEVIYALALKIKQEAEENE